MRSLILIGLLVTFASPIFAQVSFSADHREVCAWNAKGENFDRCNKQAENSLFRLNAGETMLTHTTDDIESAYYINSKEKVEDSDVWRLDVTSDVGNNYIYFIDASNKEIRVLVDQGNDDFLLIRFYLKQIW